MPRAHRARSSSRRVTLIGFGICVPTHDEFHLVQVAIKFFLRPAGYRAERMVRTAMDAEASECVLRFAEQNPISLPDGRIYHAPPCVIMMRGQSMADLMPPNSTPMRDDEKLKVRLKAHPPGELAPCIMIEPHMLLDAHALGTGTLVHAW